MDNERTPTGSEKTPLQEVLRLDPRVAEAWAVMREAGLSGQDDVVARQLRKISEILGDIGFDGDFDLPGDVEKAYRRGVEKLKLDSDV